MSRLIELYPASWRARYGEEMELLLAERPPTARDVVDLARAAAWGCACPFAVQYTLGESNHD